MAIDLAAPMLFLAVTFLVVLVFFWPIVFCITCMSVISAELALAFRIQDMYFLLQMVPVVCGCKGPPKGKFGGIPNKKRLPHIERVKPRTMDPRGASAREIGGGFSSRDPRKGRETAVPEKGWPCQFAEQG